MAAKKILTICSSASFYREVLDIGKKLKEMGFKVEIPLAAAEMRKSGNFNVEDYKVWFRDKKFYSKKTKLMNGHYKKIIRSHAILVVNNEKRKIPGYIGGATLMEMAIANYFKKKIFILNDINAALPVEEEVRGLNPIFLRGDLSKINV